MATVIYSARRKPDRTVEVVRIEQRGRLMSCEAMEHCSDREFVRYGWGEISPDANELARAILFDVTDNWRTTSQYSAKFAREVLYGAPDAGWSLRNGQVIEWIIAAIQKMIPERTLFGEPMEVRA